MSTVCLKNSFTKKNQHHSLDNQSICTSIKVQFSTIHSHSLQVTTVYVSPTCVCAVLQLIEPFSCQLVESKNAVGIKTEEPSCYSLANMLFDAKPPGMPDSDNDLNVLYLNWIFLCSDLPPRPPPPPPLPCKGTLLLSLWPELFILSPTVSSTPGLYHFHTKHLHRR